MVEIDVLLECVEKSTGKGAGKAASLTEDKNLKKYWRLNNDYY